MSSSDLAAPKRSRLPSWPAIGAIMAATAMYMATQGWRNRHLFLINATESLPNWAFVVERGASPVRGKLAFFVVRKTPLIVAHFGKNPQPFGKIAYGMPGDMVTRADNWVSVNGVHVGHVKPLSKRGEPLQPGPLGRIPPGCYYMGSPHPDGFDSRYADIGWVCAQQIVGTGTAVL